MTHKAGALTGEVKEKRTRFYNCLFFTAKRLPIKRTAQENESQGKLNVESLFFNKQ